jgi:hypothetical protein
MAAKKSNAHSAHKVTVRGGKLMATSRADLFLVRVGAQPVTKTPEDQEAGPLLRKVGRALSRPGVSREAVFGKAPKSNFFVYSLDPSDPNRMIREDAAGNRTVGRMVNGAFRKVAAAA